MALDRFRTPEPRICWRDGTPCAGSACGLIGCQRPRWWNHYRDDAFKSAPKEKTDADLIYHIRFAYHLWRGVSWMTLWGAWRWPFDPSVGCGDPEEDAGEEAYLVMGGDGG